MARDEFKNLGYGDGDAKSEPEKRREAELQKGVKGELRW